LAYAVDPESGVGVALVPLVDRSDVAGQRRHVAAGRV